MNLQSYRDEIRLRLTGDLLDLEISDDTIDRIINSALREVQRYICSTRLLTTSFSKCIDFSNITDDFEQPLKVSAVTNIYRSTSASFNSSDAITDPMYGQQWQIINATGNMYNFQNNMYNYASWSTMQQLKNTLSTDLSWYFDKLANKLYINVSTGIPSKITIEYIPRFDSVEEVTSDYWIDILVRLSVALTKVTLGRIRSRFTEAQSLWSQDGGTLLEEGNAELTELRTSLQKNAQLMYPRD